MPGLNYKLVRGIDPGIPFQLDINVLQKLFSYPTNSSLDAYTKHIYDDTNILFAKCLLKVAN